jgi:putative colanic acid biosynthesis acetyltransferase WcaF
MNTTDTRPPGCTDLSRFSNNWYMPGRALLTRIAWIVVNASFFLTWFPWPSRLKVALLRAFGARVGHGVVLKPRINVKYPWHLEIGDYAWIGEGAWLDSLARISIGPHACLSQGCTVETGNHDWSKPTFDLILREVVIEDGAWAAAKCLLLPGSRLASHSVLGAGSVLSGATEPYSVYVGVPARKVRVRVIQPQD